METLGGAEIIVRVHVVCARFCAVYGIPLGGLCCVVACSHYKHSLSTSVCHTNTTRRSLTKKNTEKKKEKKGRTSSELRSNFLNFCYYK